jgi:putative MATE family efflux protein
MDEHNERAKRLGEGSIGKLLLSFSIPAIIGMLVNALYNVVDRIFIGRGVSGTAIGALYVGMPISLILMAFSMLIGIGGNTLVSIRLGQNRKEDADRIAGNSVVLLAIISVVIATLGLIFLEPLLKILGASESNLQYAMDYLRIILLGAPFQAVGFGMNNFIRGEGNPKIAMMTMLIGALLNTALDPLFIFVFKMGVQGAALATIISQAVSAIWVMRYFLSGQSMLTIKKEYLKLKWPIFKEIVSIGFSPFSMQLAASMVTILLNNNLQKYGGDLATSSMGVIQSVAMMILMPMFGLNQGAQPIIGFNYGAEKYDRVKRTLGFAIIGASSIGIIGFLATQFYTKNILELFISDAGDLDKILGIAIPGMKTYLMMLPIIGFQVISASFFQAIGKPKHSAFLSLSRQVIILIPALIILPNIFGLKGIWMAGPIADTASSIITAALLFHFLKQLNVKEKNLNSNNIIREN